MYGDQTAQAIVSALSLDVAPQNELEVESAILKMAEATQIMKGNPILAQNVLMLLMRNAAAASGSGVNRTKYNLGLYNLYNFGCDGSGWAEGKIQSLVDLSDISLVEVFGVNIDIKYVAPKDSDYAPNSCDRARDNNPYFTGFVASFPVIDIKNRSIDYFAIKLPLANSLGDGRFVYPRSIRDAVAVRDRLRMALIGRSLGDDLDPNIDARYILSVAE